jgi:transposase-like protein
MVKVLHRYSEAFRRSVVAEVEAGHYTVLQAAAAHQLHFATVYQWMKRYGGPDSQTRTVRVEMPDERNRIKELEKEKRALESALAQAHMKIILLESTVEVLEEKAGRRTKKKTDTPSSSEPTTKDSV